MVEGFTRSALTVSIDVAGILTALIALTTSIAAWRRIGRLERAIGRLRPPESSRTGRRGLGRD